jgi:hypothetical protein
MKALFAIILLTFASVATADSWNFRPLGGSNGAADFSMGFSMHGNIRGFTEGDNYAYGWRPWNYGRQSQAPGFKGYGPYYLNGRDGFSPYGNFLPDLQEK